MPSPFPGMAPYLENRLHWRGFHELFVSAMTASLNANLPEGFAANVDERLYVLWEQKTIYPDVVLIERHHRENVSTGSVSLLEAPALIEDDALEVDLLADEQRESYIEVLQLAAGDVQEHVVAVIEVLSPANKTSFDGREEYRRKQQATLRSSVNFLEIDLLSQGPHTVAVPANSVLNSDGSAAVWDYVVSLHLGDSRRRFRVWPRTLRQPLPLVMIPLVPEEPGVLLNLQAAFDQAYDSGPYRRRIDYSLDPEPGVPAQDAVWLDQLLHDRGFRE